MNSIQEAITIAADRRTVFQAYVGHINEWWPRQGTYRYSFAPAGVEPRHIQFEPQAGGRFFETFSDGSEYDIGQITAWEPPGRLVYTWRDPRWPAHTVVEVLFTERDGRTTVTIHHTGFGENGVPADGAGYQVGLQEILASLGDWLGRREQAAAH